jgi:succinate dehydrogenase / fumarate reductase cytochrome b subunit
MRFAYYPGCTAKASTQEVDLATNWLARKVGIELIELVEAGCCGSCEIKAVNPTLHLMLNARILALAVAKNLEILTICDTCQANLVQTSRRLESEPGLRATVADKLRNAGVVYTVAPRVRHLVAILAQEIGAGMLTRHVSRPLTGVTVAPFACCHAFRGPGSDPGSRGALDDLVALSGATAVPVRADSDCCGFHILMVNPDLAARTAGKFLTRCADMEVDCVVTTSPLCHTALDIYQKKVESATGRPLGIPVLHVEQLLALSFGCSPAEAGLQRHMVSVDGLLEKLPATRL